MENLHNTVYFKETSPGVFELDRKFKIKFSYVAFKEYNAINEFCFRIRDRISNLVAKNAKEKLFQNFSNQEKKKFNNLIKKKNISVCIKSRYKLLPPSGNIVGTRAKIGNFPKYEKIM